MCLTPPLMSFSKTNFAFVLILNQIQTIISDFIFCECSWSKRNFCAKKISRHGFFKKVFIRAYRHSTMRFSTLFFNHPQGIRTEGQIRITRRHILTRWSVDHAGGFDWWTNLKSKTSLYCNFNTIKTIKFISLILEII